MTITLDRTAMPAPSADRDMPTGLMWALRDSVNEAGRHLRALPRNPDQLVFATLQPVMFVLLFRYVFGGAISAPGFSSYAQFMIPGIFAQTMVFGSTYTAIGLAEDLQKGFIDRLRSLPISQSAVLVGRIFSDMARNLLAFFVMLVVAFLVGFRFEGGIPKAILASLLLLLFAVGFSWIQAFIGLKVNSVEAANSASFIWMFPLTFVSSAFVPTETMPDWLARIADLNPFTRVTNAARDLYAGNPATDDLWAALVWAVAIIGVFSVLSVRAFRQAASR
jgi:ABC-2 type transport system permease protein/oleandomycin transport system permease protein